MATRYSYRRNDGTVVYLDTEQEVLEERRRDLGQPAKLFDFSGVAAIFGFFISVLVVCATFYGLDLGTQWPKWVRFLIMLVAIAGGTYLAGRIGWFLFYSIWIVLGVGLVVGVLSVLISIVWRIA